MYVNWVGSSSQQSWYFKTNTLLLKAKLKNIFLRFALPHPTENFKIIYYNDSSVNLKVGGSQGRFIIYLICENVSSQIMRKSKKLPRKVKL